MARVFIIMLMICLCKLVSAESNIFPSFFYPIEHRSDIKNSQDKASLNGYELQVVPNDQFAVTEYDPASLSILDVVWEFIPSPFTVIKKICSKVWKVAKLLIPVHLVLLGMALVVGFCAFTPFCTLIIEKPLVLQLRSFRQNVPYLDDVQYYFNEAYSKLQDMQSL